MALLRIEWPKELVIKSGTALIISIRIIIKIKILNCFYA